MIAADSGGNSNAGPRRCLAEDSDEALSLKIAHQSPRNLSALRLVYAKCAAAHFRYCGK
jgi:hypothetical protein